MNFLIVRSKGHNVEQYPNALPHERRLIQKPKTQVSKTPIPPAVPNRVETNPELVIGVNVRKPIIAKRKQKLILGRTPLVVLSPGKVPVSAPSAMNRDQNRAEQHRATVLKKSKSLGSVQKKAENMKNLERRKSDHF